MLPYLIRALLILMPQFFLCQLATLLFLGEDIKQQWRKIILFSFLAALIALPNIYLIAYLRMIFNIILVLLLFRLIFCYSWWECAKILFVFFFFTISAEVIFHFLLSYGFKIHVSLDNSMSILKDKLIPCMLSIYISSLLIILIAYLLRKTKFYFLLFFENVKNNYLKLSPVIISFSLQLVILVGLWSQIPNFIDIRQSPFLAAVNLLAVLTLIALIIYALYKTMQITEASAFQASGESISQDIMDLIFTVRSQRHDFLNHIQVMVSLLYNNKQAELKEYLTQLSYDVSRLNDILKIDNPFLAALLNAKVTLANTKGIRLDIQVDSSLSVDYSKVIPLVRIVGNLIDNALEAVEIRNIDERLVSIRIYENGPVICIKIANSGTPAPETIERFFIPGYSSKSGEHSGLGLNICRTLVEQMHGDMEYSCDEASGTCFSVIIPK